MILPFSEKVEFVIKHLRSTKFYKIFVSFNMKYNTAYVKIFANCVQQFLEDLSLTFPEEKNLKYYRQYARSALHLKPGMVLEYFVQFVMPYKGQIRAQDENFFLNKDYTEEEQLANQEIGSQDMLQAIRLKELWASMSDSSKTKVWKYLQNMLTAAEGATNSV